MPLLLMWWRTAVLSRRWSPIWRAAPLLVGHADLAVNSDRFYNIMPMSPVGLLEQIHLQQQGRTRPLLANNHPGGGCLPASDAGGHEASDVYTKLLITSPTKCSTLCLYWYACIPMMLDTPKQYFIKSHTGMVARYCCLFGFHIQSFRSVPWPPWVFARVFRIWVLLVSPLSLLRPPDTTNSSCRSCMDSSSIDTLNGLGALLLKVASSLPEKEKVHHSSKKELISMLELDKCMTEYLEGQLLCILLKIPWPPPEQVYFWTSDIEFLQPKPPWSLVLPEDHTTNYDPSKHVWLLLLDSAKMQSKRYAIATLGQEQCKGNSANLFANCTAMLVALLLSSTQVEICDSIHEMIEIHLQLVWQFSETKQYISPLAFESWVWETHYQQYSLCLHLLADIRRTMLYFNQDKRLKHYGKFLLQPWVSQFVIVNAEHHQLELKSQRDIDGQSVQMRAWEVKPEERNNKQNIFLHGMVINFHLSCNVGVSIFSVRSYGLLHTFSHGGAKHSTGPLVLSMSKYEEKEVSLTDQDGMHSVPNAWLFVLWEWDDSEKSVQAPLLLKFPWPLCY